MEISTEKTKLRTSGTSCINTEIKINGQKLEPVTHLAVVKLTKGGRV